VSGINITTYETYRIQGDILGHSVMAY